ncbi:hypothetical protein HMPREF0731_3748 [Pseudoroseomonas cervicalis ATCC 49957]|uniref:Uncharacterized protein n=1 Tax=Pseudoroseomonas cervicalis ATCC 49957 TaxID=525371 RepID=D5RRN6_9PROT|nr:hypothetical protein HMPREF0731_3748 [Pseudoroseomonas cervicalis ATCC 49957]
MALFFVVSATIQSRQGKSAGPVRISFRIVRFHKLPRIFAALRHERAT